MTKSKSPPPAPPSTNIQIVCQEPIIVPRDAELAEEARQENPAWFRLLLLGGILAVLMGVAWLAPAQTQVLWQCFIQRLFQAAGFP